MGSKFANGESPVQIATKKYRRKLLVRIQCRVQERLFSMVWNWRTCLLVDLQSHWLLQGISIGVKPGVRSTNQIVACNC